MKLRLGERVFEPTAGRPLVMGIVNASPDSFSDPGQRSADALVEAAMAQVAAGADLIDVGGESGVTHTQPVDPDEEIARVLPVVERLAASGVAVSVDTWKPRVADAALAAGAVLVNDVSGLRDPALADACAEHGAGLVVMHTRAAPKVKSFPGYDDVVADVERFLADRMALAADHGVARESVVLDPGPDFAKTPAETVAVLRALPRLRRLGRPLLLAASRKDFVGAVTGRPPRERLAGTLAAVGFGVDAGAAIVRVHDVPATTDFLRVRRTLAGDSAAPGELPEGLRVEEPAA
jgi:dihydropteroate synthase